MKRNTKIILILNIAIIILMLGILIYQLFFAEVRNVKLITRAGTLFLVYFLAMTGIKKKQSPLDYIIYADEYSEVIGEAFKNDKPAYKKLMKGLTLYKRKKYDKALKVLDEVKRDCLYSDDFTSVLYFKACCHKEKKELSKAEECLKEIIEHNSENSLVWEMYGEVLLDNEKWLASVEAYEKAVELNPESSSANCKLGGAYIKISEPEKALGYILKALEIEPSNVLAISFAAVAYKFLGDSENAEKYCEMFGKYGGDVSTLRIIVNAIKAV
ncbi:MAG: hypothetical protein IJZ65_01540 [Ruminiclostridium sp.]|nr:hypothetical protein [Ruminiclostridium sp.]